MPLNGSDGSERSRKKKKKKNTASRLFEKQGDIGS